MTSFEAQWGVCNPQPSSPPPPPPRGYATARKRCVIGQRRKKNNLSFIEKKKLNCADITKIKDEKIQIFLLKY